MRTDYSLRETTMIDQVLDREKITAVRAYLQAEFPGYSIQEQYDSQLKALSFRVSDQGSTYHALVTHEFLDHHEAQVIGTKLARFTLAEHLRDLPSQPIIVTNGGLELEY
jgi:hypothetical protein